MKEHIDLEEQKKFRVAGEGRGGEGGDRGRVREQLMWLLKTFCFARGESSSF